MVFLWHALFLLLFAKNCRKSGCQIQHTPKNSKLKVQRICLLKEMASHSKCYVNKDVSMSTTIYFFLSVILYCHGRCHFLLWFLLYFIIVIHSPFHTQKIDLSKKLMWTFKTSVKVLLRIILRIHLSMINERNILLRNIFFFSLFYETWCFNNFSFRGKEFSLQFFF